MYFYILVLLLIVVLLVVSLELIKHSKAKTAQLAAVRDFQEKHELSSRDLKLFKETMKEAKEQILAADGSFSRDEEDGSSTEFAIKACKEIFKYLMDNPKEIISYGDFLYRSLPAFSNALMRETTIQKAQIQKEEIVQTSNVLDNVITELAEIIIADYNRCMKDELEETVIETTVAKQGDNQVYDEKTEK